MQPQSSTVTAEVKTSIFKKMYSLVLGYSSSIFWQIITSNVNMELISFYADYNFEVIHYLLQ